MKTKFLIGCCFFLLSCSSQKETKETEIAVKQDAALTITDSIVTSTSTETDSDSLKQLKQSILSMRFDYEKSESFFKLAGIKQIDGVSAFDRNSFRPLTLNEYYAAFQDTSDYNYGEYNLAYYYSNQGEWNGLKRCIFVKLEEGYFTTYHYNIYDQDGKKVNSFVVASRGAEGGWTIDGDFITLDDSTFKQTTVTCEYGIDEQGSEIAGCDSVITIFSLTGNGRLDQIVESKHTIQK